MKKTFFLSSIIIQASFASVLSFYHNALNKIGLEKQQIYINNSKNLQISALKEERFLNFSSNISFNRRKDKDLPHCFNKTYINIQDEIDIFNKNANKIRLLALSMNNKHIALNIQKRKFFIYLINMIGTYQKTKAILNLYKHILNQQLILQKRLKESVEAGNISKLEYIKFANDLILLQYKIKQMQNIVNTMKSTLKLYGNDIPTLSFTQLHASLSQFLRNDPVLKLNKNKSKEYMTKVSLLKDSWLPKMFVGIQREYDNDPTANGDSVTFTVGLKMHFNPGINKKIQAADMEALNISSQYEKLLIQQKAEYIKYVNQYKTSKETLNLLKSDIISVNNNLTALKSAYMKHYINLTDYLQALNILIHTKVLYINAKFNNIISALILNNLSKGTIYK